MTLHALLFSFQAATAVAAPGKAGSNAGDLSADALEAISGDMPNITLSREDIVGKSIIDVLVSCIFAPLRDKENYRRTGPGSRMDDKKKRPARRKRGM